MPLIVDRNNKPNIEGKKMAKAVGVSKATMQRIWSANGLKPHLVKTFKVSNDRHFAEKLRDVVGDLFHRQ